MLGGFPCGLRAFLYLLQMDFLIGENLRLLGRKSIERLRQQIWPSRQNDVVIGSIGGI